VTLKANKKYFRQAVAARWAAIVWFNGLICTWQLHAASSLRSATYISKHAGANQTATRLLRHCSGPARCCSQPASQPAGIGLPTSHRPTWGHHSKSLGLSARITTTPIDIKPSTCPAHGRRHAFACKISPSYDAAFRRRWDRPQTDGETDGCNT